MNKTLVSALLVGACVGASAQVNVIGPFAGSLSEGYETQVRGMFLAQYSVFGGAGTVDQFGGGSPGVLVTTGWSFFSNIGPHSGEAFLGGAGVNYEYNFNTPALRFGGWFGTNADTPDATVAFFDENEVQIGSTLTASAPLGQWQWNGWEYAGGISRVQVRANNQFGGFIMNDDMQYTAVPEPATMAFLGFGVAALVARRQRRSA